MDKTQLASMVVKYAAAGCLMGSLFYLAVTGKISVDAYMSLAVGGIAGITGHAVGSANPRTPS